MALQFDHTEKDCPHYAMCMGQRIDLPSQDITVTLTARVTEMVGDKTGGSAVVTFSGSGIEYQKTYPLPFGIVSPIVESPDIATPVYVHLKTLEEFQGAIDV